MNKRSLAVLILASIGLPTIVNAEADTFGLGTGRSGALALNLGDNLIVNTYAQVTASLSIGSENVPVASVAGFAAGDLVMVFQATGLSSPMVGSAVPLDISGTPIGTYEFARVQSVGAADITLTHALIQAYGTGAQLIRVPEYTSVTVPVGAAIRAQNWNGATGGVVAFLVTGMVVNNGQIHANAAGFRGGVAEDTGPGGNYATACAALIGYAPGTSPSAQATPLLGGAHKGEGFYPSSFATSTTGAPADIYGFGNVAHAGGGGNCTNAGGGGGGLGGNGGNGGATWMGDGRRDVGGRGGVALAGVTDRLVFGGGGGSGEMNDGVGTAGAAGGGVLFVRALSIGGSGSYSVNGASAAAGGNDGGGGGGAGGSVYLFSMGAVACGSIRAQGGGGGDSTGDHGSGAGGGGGIVNIAGTVDVGCAVGAPGGAAGTTNALNQGAAGSVGVINTSAVFGGTACSGANLASALCGGCVADGECGGATPFCDLGPNRCVACLDAAACEDSNDCTADSCSSGSCINAAVGIGTVCGVGVCNGSGACVTCVEDSQCGGASPICNVSINMCVGCTADFGNGAATACPSSDEPYCNLTGGMMGQCGDCTMNSQCGTGHSGMFCNVATGACGDSCTQDSDCASTEWCPQSGTCSPRAGNGDAVPAAAPLNGECTGPNGARGCVSAVCDVADDLCGLTSGSVCAAAAECRAGACGAGNLCGIADGDVCTAGTECRSGICSPGGVCGVCDADSDCGAMSSGLVCSEVGQCEMGCRGSGGNVCPGGQMCSSTDNAIGQCSLIPVMDGGVDGGFDAGADASMDSGTDSGIDAGTDGGADASRDGGTDSGSGDSGSGDSGSGDSGSGDSGSGTNDGGVDGGLSGLSGGACTCRVAARSVPVGPALFGMLLMMWTLRRRPNRRINL